MAKEDSAAPDESAATSAKNSLSRQFCVALGSYIVWIGSASVLGSALTANRVPFPVIILTGVVFLGLGYSIRDLGRTAKVSATAHFLAVIVIAIILASIIVTANHMSRNTTDFIYSLF